MYVKEPLWLSLHPTVLNRINRVSGKVCQSDSGKRQFNYSEVFGECSPSDRTLDNAAKVWAVQYGYDTITLVVKEFWPGIRRILVHKNRAGAASPPKRTVANRIMTERFPNEDYSVN